MTLIPCPAPYRCGVQSGHVAGSAGAINCAARSGTRVNGATVQTPPSGDPNKVNVAYADTQMPRQPGLEALAAHGYEMKTWPLDTTEYDSFADMQEEYPECVYAEKPLGDTGWSVSAYGGHEDSPQVGYSVYDGNENDVMAHGEHDPLPEWVSSARMNTGSHVYVLSDGSEKQDADLRAYVEQAGARAAANSQRLVTG